jgi:hypothetical protein
MATFAIRRGLRSESLRVLMLAAVGSVLAGYAVLAAAIAVTISLASRATASLQSVLAATGPGWLAAWHIPLRLRGAELGVLPLGASVLMVCLVAGTAARAATRLRAAAPRDALPIILALAGAHAGAGVLVALAWQSRTVQVSPALALLGCGVFAGIAAAGGLAARAKLVRACSAALRPLYWRGILAGGLALAALAGLGTLVYAGGLLTSLPAARAMLSTLAPGPGAAVGVILLCVGYLPNAVIGAMSFVAGTGVHVGALSLTPFGYVPGHVPGLPLLAALPEHRAAWWPALLVLPLALGVLLGWYLREADPSPLNRIRVVATSAVTAALGALVLALLAGGTLGGGELSGVGVPAVAFAGAVLGWLALPGALLAYLAGPRGEGHLAVFRQAAPARLIAAVRGWCRRSGR